jgi:polyvinyl alcohol dehydrogenase (cytochrome)
LTLGVVNKPGDTTASALFFGDVEAHTVAVDALTGELIWRVDAAVSEHSFLTGAPVQHEQRLIVPVSLYEVILAADPDHECCKSHGAVLAMDANTGDRLWVRDLTGPAQPRELTRVGTQSYGPSGVPVWSTPTVDVRRSLIYVGTGQNASLPATEYSDAVIALDLESGEVVWHFQAIAGDAYNAACEQRPPGPNCPKWKGPDHDIGASVILTRNSSGQDVLLVGQKSGDVYALDPDEGGRMIWQKRAGAGSFLGGVHWGMATADGKVFVPISDPAFPIPGYYPSPGLYALDVDDGSRVWSAPVERGCETNMFDYFGRESLYPDCAFYYGLSAAPVVVNDVVFSPSLDGQVHAFAVADGQALWGYDTLRSFETVNGVEAHGGSIDVAGVQAADRMIYVQSGYSMFGQLPGNVLLAFRLCDVRSESMGCANPKDGANSLESD